MANILVIDDDERIRSVVRRILLDDNHEVREAADGVAAMTMMRERAPDIIVSDVYMPEMDGIELLIRMYQEFPNARVVTMTGGGNMPSAELLEMGKSLGAKATLAKPFTPDELRAAIAACGLSSPPTRR